jgi:hypothetical protein
MSFFYSFIEDFLIQIIHKTLSIIVILIGVFINPLKLKRERERSEGQQKSRSKEKMGGEVRETLFPGKGGKEHHIVRRFPGSARSSF